MTQDVYFAGLRSRSPKQNKSRRIRQLFEKAFEQVFSPGDFVAVKIHFGEMGGDSFIHPVYVRQVVDCVKEQRGRVFLADTNTLYTGSRNNAVEHLQTAIRHGFAYAVVDAPVIIADGLKGRNFVEVSINQHHFSRVKIAADFVHADSMLVLSHFKGHELSGFGGAIKNLAMGCAAIAGKREQHNAQILLKTDKCIGCFYCVNNCPTGALSKGRGVVNIDNQVCIGCGECLTVCPERALWLDWSTEIPPFLERMAEYAYGAVKNKGNRVGYFNFLLNIVPDCDCCPWSDAAIVPDIGILASRDPVALDRASLDLINQEKGLQKSMLKANHACGADKFQGLRPHIDGCHLLNYAEKIGLGSQEYNLVNI